MMKINVNELLKQLREEGFKSHNAIISPNLNECHEDEDYIVDVVPSLEYEDETDVLCDLDKCSNSRLIALIEWCEFEVVMHDKESILEIANHEDDVDDEAIAYFSLNDWQRANLGGICGDVFNLSSPTMEKFRDEVLLNMIDRMEIYWGSYGIQFA